MASRTIGLPRSIHRSGWPATMSGPVAGSTASRSGSLHVEIPALNLEFHVQFRTVKIAGVPVQLTPIECSLMRHFIESDGKLIDRRDLIMKIWGGTTVSRNVLDTHIGNLKKKVPVLGPRLKSIYGSGYVFQSKD